MNPTTPFWKQPHIYVTLLLMVPIYFVVYKVVGDTTNAFSDTIKVMVVTAIISSALSGLLGFWLGTSQSSVRKDETTAALTLTPPPAAPAVAQVTANTAFAAASPAGTPGDPVNVQEVKP